MYDNRIPSRNKYIRYYQNSHLKNIGDALGVYRYIFKYLLLNDDYKNTNAKDIHDEKIQ